MRIPNAEARAKIGKKVIYEVMYENNTETKYRTGRMYSFFYSDLDSAIRKYDELCVKYPYPKSRYVSLKRWNTSAPVVTEIYDNRMLGRAGEYRNIAKRR